MDANGVQRRLRRILPYKGAIVLPIDGGLIDGPAGALANLTQFFDKPLLANVNSILGFHGLLKSYSDQLSNTPFIANLSASTVLSSHTHKRIISSVESAVRAGADAVSFQIHLSDAKEGSMLRDLGKIIDHAERWGMPVVTIAYPRRNLNNHDDNYRDLLRDRPEEYVQLVCHAVRVAVELGSNAVKTVYTGTAESFSEVVQVACGVPVLVAGGPACSDAEAEAKAISAVSAGAWGIAYGRQIFMHSDPVKIACRLRKALDAAIGHDSNK